MKIAFTLKIVALVAVLGLGSLTKVNKVRQDIRPNLGDIVQNLEHPFYEQQYKPTEVKSLADILPKPQNNIYDMANAIILGDKPRNTDLDQKPTLYSTVITSHPTSVVHPTKPIGNAIVSDPAAVDQFGGLEKKLPPGTFESPVKIANLNLIEKGFGQMEKPVFISKEQKNLNANVEQKQIPMLANAQKISNVVETAANLDANQIKERLKGLKANEREKKLRGLQRARADLAKQAKAIKSGIEKETDHLLGAKSASINMGLIVKSYEERLKKDKLAHLRLADRVEVKKQLKDKLIKEIQGFRTRPSEYKELLRVDKATIKAVVQSIKQQLEVISDQSVKNNQAKEHHRRRR